MNAKPTGRPRQFHRDEALRQAAHLFWQHGYSGTSTRALTATLGISSSSLYAAFGSKAELFDEAVRTYALRYSAVYDRALLEPTLAGAIERLLKDSVLEFTRADEGHPGCLTTSAVMADTSVTLDVRTYVADLQRADEARLCRRIEQALAAGELEAKVEPAALSELVQTVWQGLSTRAELGATRHELFGVVDLAMTLIAPGVRASASAV